ncbi:MAG: hypothetical protein WCW27_06320 [Patescibacteria group bacterium]|jgi:NAD+ kinase
MNIAICGLEKNNLASYLKKHYSGKFNLVKTNPEFVLCYGGDGTLLFAERNYPGVPKVMIRKSRVCYHCVDLTKETILRLLLNKQYRLQTHQLLQATACGKTLYGLNDIVVGHRSINTGLRFKVYLDGEQYGREFLGDGVVVATPIGSTGYYQSITRSTFQRGLGIAFNNAINNIGHLVIDPKIEIMVKVTREPAVVTADNNQKMINIQAGDKVVIKLAKQRSTKIVYFPGKHYKPFNLGLNEDRVPLGYCQVCSKLFND